MEKWNWMRVILVAKEKENVAGVQLEKFQSLAYCKRGGKVYTQIIPDAKRTTLLPIIKQKILPDSIVYTDSLRSYATLNIEGFHHYRINHSKVLAKGHNHINGIENFWNQAKRHLRKFNGIPKEHFYLFLKECEWRFNYGKPKNLAKVLTNWVKLYS